MSGYGSDVGMDRSSRPEKRGRVYLSWVLFVISGLLFLVVAVLWYRDRESQPDAIAPPTSVPGMNSAIHVKQALEAQGLTVAFAQGGGRTEELSVAGQYLTVDDVPLYVFIYPRGAARRETETAGVDLSPMVIRNTRGTPVAGGPPTVSFGSNVVAVLYGGSEELTAKVKAAIEGLP